MPDLVRLAHGGAQFADQLAALDWAYEATGSATGPTIAVPRGRVMGGSGAINGTIFLRGTPEDFTSWADLVGPEWGWDHVGPAYRAIEADPVGSMPTMAGTGRCPSSTGRNPTGSLTQAAFHEACQELGYGLSTDHNAPGSMGVGALPLNQRQGMRVSPAAAFLTAGGAGATQPAHRARDRGPQPGHRGRPCDRCRGGDRGVARPRSRRARSSSRPVPWAARTLMLRAGIGPADDLRKLGIPVVSDVPGMGIGVRGPPQVVDPVALARRSRAHRQRALAATLGTLHRDRLRPARRHDAVSNSVVAGSDPGTVRLPDRGRQQPPAVGGAAVAAFGGFRCQAWYRPRAAVRAPRPRPTRGSHPPVHRAGPGQPAAGAAGRADGARHSKRPPAMPSSMPTSTAPS